MKQPFYILFALITLLVSCKSFQKKKELSSGETTYLLLDDLTSQYIELYNCPIDTTLDLDSLTLQLSVIDCRGELSFELADKDGHKKIKGQYINGLDTLKKYSIGKSAITGEKSRSILKFFQPIPFGTWQYFKINGQVDSVVFKDGFKTMY